MRRSLSLSQRLTASLMIGSLSCPGISHPHAEILVADNSAATFQAEASAPPRGVGIVQTLRSDQDVYTNHAARVWCPSCITNEPPCLLPCYLLEEETAVAKFTFEVTNQFPLPRTFQFSTSQQFDLEIVDETGRVLAAWSDGKYFTQSLTSFTLDRDETRTFTAEIPLIDRDGKQLNGYYQVRSFLTTSGSEPRTEATTQIIVTLAP